MRLWEILDKLYNDFREALLAQKLCYSGMQYREVAEKFETMAASDFPYKRIIMVGFNVLSISELCIFSRLNELNIADFYWDYSFPKELTNNMATYFIRRYVKQFKSRYDINKDDVRELPEINVIGIPSNVGQVKYAGQLIDNMVNDHTISNPKNAIDTAIVLPSEDLFIELLHSIPESITKSNTGATPTVNITMGYPMKLTPAAALMRSVTAMHIKAKKIRDTFCYFYEDICNVLANPLISRIAPDDCEAIRKYIEDKRMFNVPSETLVTNWPALQAVFFPVNNVQSGKNVFDYTLSLISFLEQKLEESQTLDSAHDDEPESPNGNAEDADSITGDDLILPEKEEDTPQPIALELGFLTRYRKSVERLRSIADKNGITMHNSTFFHLIRSVVDAETVTFTGEPLKGLQIMGILETRALNFDNLIILSMNERIFPKRHFTRSFIPNTMRRCFGMATTEFQECIFSYYFYRMVAAAKKVTLLYDTRTEALNSGDMSRYIYQLIHNYPHDRIHLHNAAFDLPISEPVSSITIAKDDEMMKRINSFRATPDNQGERNYLSPSAINTYLSCPLKFCLHYLRNLSDKGEVTDYMDESTFGSVFHQVMEYAYKDIRGNKPSVEITNSHIENILKQETMLENLITSAINQHFNRLKNKNCLNATSPNDCKDCELRKTDSCRYVNNTPLIGEAKILGEIILSQVKLLLEIEKTRTPFTFIDAEKSFKVSIPLSESLSINLKGIIDRIDEKYDFKLDENSTPVDTIEIFDYKTGSDEIDAASVSDIFPQDDEKHIAKKAILQLFLYSNAYKIISKTDKPIRPSLIRFRKLNEKVMPGIKISGNAIVDYSGYNDDILNMLAERLEPLFDKDEPFRPSPNSSHCKFCNFSMICGQKV
jgi:hypothetical protein